MHSLPVNPSSGTAFVFAGGGSLGSVQVGMLKALLRAGISADCVVGSSVGAVNAAYFAGDPTLEGVSRLEKIWRALKRSDIFPVTAFSGMLKLLSGKDYLIDPSALASLIERELPFRVLEEARIPCHVVATDLMDGQEIVMSSGSVTEALLASTAIPGIFPPVRASGHYLIDGGVANHTPLSTAADLGAERVIVLPTGTPCTLRRPPKGIIEITLHSLNLMALRQLIKDAQHHIGNVDLSIVPPPCPLSVTAYDFTHTPQLIRRAERITSKWLKEVNLAHGGIPNELYPHVHRQI